ncbi:MAG: hypothetical protein DHS20C11_35130 [Lysobacteraceae bacterium]|nr:MAG: hypothetical protein DHS20C11_35130 [Xanthomonadaceae bacterium]
MKNLILVALIVGLAACASNPSSSSKSAPEATIVQSSEEKSSAPKQRCKQVREIGSNMTKRRCTTVEQDEAEARKTQDDMARRSMSRDG